MDTKNAEWLCFYISYASFFVYLTFKVYQRDKLTNYFPNIVYTIMTLAVGALVTFIIVQQALREDKN